MTTQSPTPKPAEGELLPLPEGVAYMREGDIAERVNDGGSVWLTARPIDDFNKPIYTAAQVNEQSRANVARAVEGFSKRYADLDAAYLHEYLHGQDQQARAERAEAQVAELREALRKIEGLLIAATQPKEKT
jgi:hypothetical protein